MSVRLFVALDLPDAARAALARFRDAAADPVVWRPLDEASFHVTLAFLGHRPEEDVERVAAVLRALPPWEPPRLGAGGRAAAAAAARPRADRRARGPGRRAGGAAGARSAPGWPKPGCTSRRRARSGRT